MTQTPYKKVNLVDENGELLSLSIPASLDTVLTGGTQKAIIRGGEKGTTTSADITSTDIDENTQALDVVIKTIPAIDAPAYSLQSSTYTINAGAKKVFIANIGNADGEVLGTALPPNISIPFESSQGNTLSAIAVDGTGTTLAIVEIR